MAYTSGFFDAVDQGGGDYDRIYSAATFAHYFSLLVQNGVFPDPSTGMQVKASINPDMHVSVQPGSGWVNGYYITVEANAPERLTVPTANPSLSRIDSVIMGLNYVDREVQLYIKSGAVSASPSAVSLQRDNDLYELELAQITVSAGMASITQANITDMRSNTGRCGIVKGMIDRIDTTDLFAQYDAAFQAWFADIKAQLSGNVATNLQNQINELKTKKLDSSDKASIVQAQAGTDNTKWMTPALVKAFHDSLKASLSEAQLATDDNKWMSPSKVMSLIAAKKCSNEDILRYATMVMTETSGKQHSIKSYKVSGTIGIDSKNSDQNSARITIPLGELPSNAKIAVLENLDLRLINTGSSGSVQFSVAVKLTVNTTTITVAELTRYNTAYGVLSELNNILKGLNFVLEFGNPLSSSQTVVVSLIFTRTSGTGYDSGGAGVNYVNIRYIE